MQSKAIKILIKNQKGGVGKSLISFWLAHGLALENKTVLLLTSDSQDNIPAFAGKSEEAKQMTKGLESWVKTGEGDTLELRENLHYIPLKSLNISKEDSLKFTNFIEIIAQRVDYIIIDASPVLSLDDLFVEIADRIVIPTFLDEVTTQGIFNLIKKVGVAKIKAIIPNRAHSTKLEKDYYTELQSSFEGMSVVLTCPVKHSSAIAKLIDAGRTLWETKQKSLDPIRSEFQKVLEVIK